MDYFAIASRGAYPTPTPTVSERSSLAATFGFLDSLPESSGEALDLFLIGVIGDVIYNVVSDI